MVGYVLAHIVGKLYCCWKKSSSTLKCNPYFTKDYTFYPTDNQTIVYPVTGMTNYKHDTSSCRVATPIRSIV